MPRIFLQHRFQCFARSLRLAHGCVPDRASNLDVQGVFQGLGELLTAPVIEQAHQVEDVQPIARKCRQRVVQTDQLMDSPSDGAAENPGSSKLDDVVIVSIDLGTPRKFTHSFLVQDQTRKDILAGIDVEVSKILRRFGNRLGRGVWHVEGSVRSEKQHSSAAGRIVNLDVIEDFAEGGEQSPKQWLVDKVQPNPLDEHSFGLEVVLREFEKLLGIEMGCAGRPGVRRLRHDRVEALVCQDQGVARVVQVHGDSGILQGIPPAQIAQAAIGLDHLGLQLDHVDLLDQRRDGLERQAPPEADDQQRIRLGPSQAGQPPQPASHQPLVPGYSRSGYSAFRVAVGAEEPLNGRFQQQNRRGPSDSQVADRVLLVGSTSQRRIAQNLPGLTRGEHHQCHQTDHPGDLQPPRAPIDQAPRGGDREHQIKGHTGDQRARIAEDGNHEEARSDCAYNRSQGVHSVNPSAGGTCVGFVPGHHAHCKWEGGTDQRSRWEESQRRCNPVDQQLGVAAVSQALGQ